MSDRRARAVCLAMGIFGSLALLAACPEPKMPSGPPPEYEAPPPPSWLTDAAAPTPMPTPMPTPAPPVLVPVPPDDRGLPSS